MEPQEVSIKYKPIMEVKQEEISLVLLRISLKWLIVVSLNNYARLPIVMGAIMPVDPRNLHN
jgi:hypothetical protein